MRKPSRAPSWPRQPYQVRCRCRMRSQLGMHTTCTAASTYLSAIARFCQSLMLRLASLPEHSLHRRPACTPATTRRRLHAVHGRRPACMGAPAASTCLHRCTSVVAARPALAAQPGGWPASTGETPSCASWASWPSGPLHARQRHCCWMCRTSTSSCAAAWRCGAWRRSARGAARGGRGGRCAAQQARMGHD